MATLISNKKTDRQRMSNATPANLRPKDEKKKEPEVSMYQPDGEERDVLKVIHYDYQTALKLRNEPREEFNERDLQQIMNDSQRAYNSYVARDDEDPDEEWKANTVRPVTRNKVISIAAHIMGGMLSPTILAQNDRDEEDQDSAMVMKDLMDWSFEQSKYVRHFLFAVISAMVNPAVILYDGYAEVKRKIKEIQNDGSWKWKEMIDEEYSGFQNLAVPLDELYIGDFYEHDIQKQPFLIWRRVIDYSQAKIIFAGNEMFEEHVRAGLVIFYADEREMFYEQYDEDMSDRLVEWVRYYNRELDLEVDLVNGVMVSAPDRPMQRMDKKYPFVKTGYEPIDEGRCFYYKSLVDKMQSDQEVIDVLYNMIIDGTYLQLMPPSVVYGDEEIDTAIIAPGAVTTFSNETKMDSIGVGSNINAGLSVLGKVEGSLSESSADPLQGGQATPGTQTAFEVARLETNAKRVLGLFGKMLSFMVEDLGKLRVSSILQHMTVAEGVDILGGQTRLKFRSILVPNRVEAGEKLSRRIDFETDGKSANQGLTEEELMDRKMKLMEEESDIKGRIVKVNPKLFRKLKFKVKVFADIIQPKNEAVKKALNLEAYDRAIQNPMADPEAVFKKFLLSNYVPGEEDNYIKKPEEGPPGPEGGGAAGPSGPAGPQANQEVIKQISGVGTPPIEAESI